MTDMNVQERSFNELHPTVYLGLAGAAAWLVAAAWGFAHAADADYLLAVVTGFVAMAVALPWVLSQVGSEPSEVRRRRVPVREWLAGTVEISQGRLGGLEAALQILLPIAGLALGMTGLAIVMNIEI